MAADGRFAVAWEQADPDPTRAVRFATFGAAGARLGRPAVMRARGVDANLLGAVSAGGQSVAVGWTEVSPCPQQPIDPVSAVATFDWSLRPRGEVQRVANDNPCIDGPRVVALAGSELGPLGVFAGRRYSVQRFSPTSGERMGARTNVAELPPCSQAWCERVATVAGDGRGRFVLVWERMQGNGDQYDLFAELYGREGRLRSARFAITDASSSAAQQPSAALGADGTLLVVWRRDGRQLVVRRFRVP
jgi:hypothetical protein